MPDRLLNHALTPVLLIFAVFTALTVVMTWPLPRYMGIAVQDLGDPLYKIWIIRAVQHQLVNQPGDFWDANMGYPFEMSLLFSEPLIGTALLHWPIFLVTGNDVLGYNTLFLLSFVTVGAGMALLIRELTGSSGAGVVAGAMAAFSPYRYGHLSHLNLLSYGWLMLSLWMIVRFARTRQLRYASFGCALLILQFHASDTLAVFSLVVVAVFICACIWSYCLQRDRTFLIGAAAFVVLPVASFFPVIAGRLEMNRIYGFERTMSELIRGSAIPADYLSVHPHNYLWGGILREAYPNPLFPGLIAIVAAVIGLVLCLRRLTPWIATGAVLIVFGVVMSLGPQLDAGGRTIPLPYQLFAEYVPGGDSMRDVARFGVLALLGVHLLAGLGIAALLGLARARIPEARWTVVSVTAIVVLTALTLMEYRTETSAESVDRSPERLAVYEWLADQPDGPVLELPADGHWTSLSRSIQPMYYSTWHWHPVIALYGSFVPPEHVPLLRTMHGGWDIPSRVTDENVGLIQDLGVRYLIVHHHIDEYDSESAMNEAHELDELTYTGTFGQSSAFEVALEQRTPPSIELAGPPRARPGEDLVVAALSWNRNPSPALVTMEHGNRIVANWLRPDGELVDSQSSDVSTILTVPAGVSGIPFPLSAPDTPGDYVLELILGRDGTASDRFAVEVDSHPKDPDLDADVWLHSLTGISERYAPGDWIQVIASWEITGEPEAGMVATIQLLDDAGETVAQWDGWPYGENYQGERLPSGTPFVTPFALEIPADLPSGDYQLLVALYDHLGEGAPRYELQLTDGSSATEFMTPVTIE